MEDRRDPTTALLKFPDGKIAELPICGLRATGSEVSDYITQLKNPNLLSALLLDSRAQPDTLRAATSQLITLKGTDYVARLLATHPQETARSELAILAQLLRSPYAAIQVARITKDDMELSTAERALQEMRADLAAGTPWAAAYAKTADKHPDLKDRRQGSEKCSHARLLPLRQRCFSDGLRHLTLQHCSRLTATTFGGGISR